MTLYLGLFAFLLSIISVLFCYYDLCLHKDKTLADDNSMSFINKIKLLNFKNIKAVSSVKVTLFIVFCVLINILVAVFLGFFYINNPFLFSLKRVCILSLLWPIALIDFRSMRIPNIFILLGLIYRGLILVAELVVNFNDALWGLLFEIIAVAVLLLASFLCCLVIKGALGFGDIKFFIIMGLFLGTDGVWFAVFLSLLASLIISLVLILSKKKTRKDTIPFAPALFVGTCLSIIVTGM